MLSSPHTRSINENISSVNPCQLSFSGQEFGNPQPKSKSVIHHNVILKYPIKYSKERYGVSSSQRILSPGLFIKKYNYIWNCLREVTGLTISQREVVIRLLRLWAYYGKVYPKESQITELPGCSKATYWRTIKLLKDRGLIQVVNRYIIRPHAQISNLYHFDKLLIIIARYLAEHYTQFKEKWLQPFLEMLGQAFWCSFVGGSVSSPTGIPGNRLRHMAYPSFGSTF